MKTESIFGRCVLQEHELAERWGISVKTLQKWRQHGTGPLFYKLSGRVAYPLASIAEFEQQALRKSTSERAEG